MSPKERHIQIADYTTYTVKIPVIDIDKLAKKHGIDEILQLPRRKIVVRLAHLLEIEKREIEREREEREYDEEIRDCVYPFMR